ncbi:uncharacterized protein LOC119692015 [Plutella xylostella]|uniref:uncharacterized protein LOC119692015 n=1 Tax=Plutella xylostella TaxID=51655 RepID=UPI00203312C3|nr:uncharacterized protein LOC119692015 [Plutella xylostella]
MGTTDIELVNEIKILGLIIDRKLTFQSHVAYVCKKAINIYKGLARAAKVTWGLNPEVVRTIYVAAIEPIILYASSAWVKAADKVYIKNQLNTVMRGFAQKICKAHKTVSMNSALILTRLLPLDLRVKEAASLYEAKKGKPQPVLKGRKVEERASPLQRPHPSEEIQLDFECLESEAEVQERMTDGAAHIFTDGSKIEGKVGSALSWWNSGNEITCRKFKLEDHCTVFQAELYAVYRATELAKTRKETTLHVYSDSRSTLELLRGSDSSHQLAAKTKDNIACLSKKGKEVALF